MIQIGNVPAIKAVKNHLNELKKKGLIQEWELPYEEILTRLTAAVFFLKPAEGTLLEHVWKELESHDRFHYQPNNDSGISNLPWRFEFNKGFELGS